MVIATYSTDLTLMDEAESLTGWAEPTVTWTDLRSPGADTDDFIQNGSCISGIVKTGLGGILWNEGAGITLGQDDAVLIWAKWDAAPVLDTEANGGMVTFMGSSLAAFNVFHHLGNDSYVYGGWRNLATGDPADADITANSVVGSPTTTKQYHGWGYGAPGAVPTKGQPFKADVIRYGRCEIIAIDGQAAAYGNFADMAQENDYNDVTNGYNRWGLFQQQSAGNYLWKGLMSLGNATAVDFRDSNSSISIDNTKQVTPAFNAIEINNASSRVDWTGVTISSLGTVSPGTLTVVDNADVNFTSCTFNDMNTFVFLANSDVVDSQFIRCGLITHGGGVMNGTSVLSSIVAADEGAVFYDQVADPDGEMDNMSFSKGVNAHHAIRFGTNVPASITLRGMDFVGFSASNDVNDSVFRFDDISGAITLNLVGCTHDGSGFTIDDAAGVTVTVVIDPVTTLVNVKDNTGSNLLDARVLLEASDATGDFPFEESVTITRSGATASVAHTAHGLVVGDLAIIRGAVQSEYNGAFTISNVTTNAYDYTVVGTPTTPATGTIVCSGGIVSGTTDASGNISASRTFSANTPVKGFVRKSSVAPFFKSFPIAGTVNNTAGLTINVRMILDQ